MVHLQKLVPDRKLHATFLPPERLQARLTATVGALTIETQFGTQSVKLPAGHMVLYPSSSLHRVEPVTSGRRLASFFWIQSMVRDDGQRAILLDLDRAVQTLVAERGQGDPAIVQLTGVYHNLLRRWADS